MKRKFVSREVTRFGKTVYYFRRSKTSPRIRLPDDPTSKEFMDCYLAAMNGREFQAPLTAVKAEAAKFTRSVELAASHAVYRAKSRASKRGMEFSLSYRWVMDIIRQQDHRCILTGIYFDHTFSTDGHMKPYSPSIDRIDCRKGYTEENCRVIVSAMNIMLSDWGPAIFSEVARGFSRTNKTKKEQANPVPNYHDPAPNILLNDNNTLQNQKDEMVGPEDVT